MVWGISSCLFLPGSYPEVNSLQVSNKSIFNWENRIALIILVFRSRYIRQYPSVHQNSTAIRCKQSIIFANSDLMHKRLFELLSAVLIYHAD